jgi:hypothetical protein
MDLIEVLPSGLYEMILEEKKAEDVGADLHVTGSMWCRARGSEKSSFARAWGMTLSSLVDLTNTTKSARMGLRRSNHARIPGVPRPSSEGQSLATTGDSRCGRSRSPQTDRRRSSDPTGIGLAHGFVLACWFRNAASPASDTSTHFSSGAASAT